MLFYLLFLYYRARDFFSLFFLYVYYDVYAHVFVRNELLYDYGVCIIEGKIRNNNKPERARF